MTDHLQPGDIWRHPGMGTLYVTDEDIDLRPGYLTLIQRLGERGPDGELRLKR